MSSQSNNESHYLLIWDSQALPKITNGQVALWCSFNEGGASNTVSIPELVEENSENLRKRYLAWVYALGETKVLGRRFVDHLEIRPGFSYWWMTLFVEKCNYQKSPQIDNAIKLMALETWSIGKTLSHVKLVTANALLAQCVNAWCVKTGLIFEWQKLSEKAEKVTWPRRIYQVLPGNLKALIWLTYSLVQRWPQKGVGLQEWSQSKGRVTFFSYLDNLVPDAVSIGKFESRYWAHLPDALQRNDCKTNWLHIDVQDPLLSAEGKVATVIQRFNVTGKGDQVHVTLDTFLGWPVVFRALRDWRLVRRTGVKCQDISIRQSDVSINIWPLFADDWQRSFYGVEALSNLLYLNLYEAALSALPAQRTGVYLQENQAWEFSLVHAWKAAGHDALIGTPHSFVRFWDLRYFFDPRSYDRKIKNPLPMPDLVAVNGSAAKGAYLGGCYPVSKLDEVEALRYLYLADYSVAAPKMPRPAGSPLRVLAMGEYLLANTQLQMRLLEQAATLLPRDAVFVIKPHPNCPVNPADYPGLSMTVTMEPLSVLLAKCDIAYSSGVTSAAVDAYCVGVPVISVLDLNKLNLSPLRDCAGAVFISTSKELALALVSSGVVGRNSFFSLDSNLPRWRKLLCGVVD